VVVVVVVLVVLPVIFAVLVLLVVEVLVTVVVKGHWEQPVQYHCSQATFQPPCMVLHTDE
jgi:hypothetical protein